MRHHNINKVSRKIRPIVKIDPKGKLVTAYEYRRNEDDYQFNAPIDKYFTDMKVNKLIYETRQE